MGSWIRRGEAQRAGSEEERGSESCAPGAASLSEFNVNVSISTHASLPGLLATDEDTACVDASACVVCAQAPGECSTG